MKTYLVRFRATPTLNSPDLGKLDGAYCTIWGLSDSEQQAVQQALQWAERLGWQFAQMDEVFITERAEWLDDEVYLERFDRTQREHICGIVDSYKKDIAASN